MLGVDLIVKRIVCVIISNKMKGFVYGFIRRLYSYIWSVLFLGKMLSEFFLSGFGRGLCC